ncbi:MAG: CPBP family intramembrane metalloprotease [Anaerolineae bacterium]|nr:CPBP family intramembrane metalloprotease [Anaerolineae bacterium]
MDSLSPSSAAASPGEGGAVSPSTLPAGRRITSFDLGVRVILFGLFIAALTRQIGTAAPQGLLYPLMIYGLPAAAYLLASVPNVAGIIRRQAEAQPLGTALLALVPLVPVMAYARSALNFDLAGLLFSGVLIFLPVACAILNVPQLRRSDISLGLITVALPLLLPYAPDAGVGAPSESPTAFGVAVRIVAFLLPIALLVFTTREQKQHLNFLFVCAVLSAWYAVQFDALPNVPLAVETGISYFELAVIPLFLYMLAAAGRFDRLGLSFQPTPRGVSVVTANIALLVAVAVPLGLVTRSLVPAFHGPPPLEAAAQALSIFLLVALPQEILFRGTLLTYLQDVLGLSNVAAVVASAIIFGMAHLSAPADIGWPFILAALAGVFYARTFLATRNVASAGVVHAFANWVRWLLFGG